MRFVTLRTVSGLSGLRRPAVASGLTGKATEGWGRAGSPLLMPTALATAAGLTGLRLLRAEAALFVWARAVLFAALV